MSTDTTKSTSEGTTKTSTNENVLANRTNKGVKKAQRLRGQIKGQTVDEIAKTVSEEAREPIRLLYRTSRACAFLFRLLVLASFRLAPSPRLGVRDWVAGLNCRCPSFLLNY